LESSRAGVTWPAKRPARDRVNHQFAPHRRELRRRGRYPGEQLHQDIALDLVDDDRLMSCIGVRGRLCGQPDWRDGIRHFLFPLFLDEHPCAILYFKLKLNAS